MYYVISQVKTDSLQDANKLLERHMESQAKLQSDLTLCQKQLDNQLEKYEALKQRFDETCKQREVDLQAHANKQEQWQIQVRLRSHSVADPGVPCKGRGGNL